MTEKDLELGKMNQEHAEYKLFEVSGLNGQRLLDFARLLFSVLPENALEEAYEKLGRVEFRAHWHPGKEPTPVIYKVQEALRKMLPVDRQQRYFQQLVEGLDLQEAPFIVDATHWNVRDENLRTFDEVKLWNKDQCVIGRYRVDPGLHPNPTGCGALV